MPKRLEFAFLTAAAAGALSLTRLRGEGATARIMAELGLGKKQPRPGRLLAAPFRFAGEVLDEVLLQIQSDEELTIGWHGGAALQSAARRALQAMGFSEVRPECLLGRDRFAAEALALLPTAETERATALLLGAAAGELGLRCLEVAARLRREGPSGVSALKALFEDAEIGIAHVEPPVIVLLGPPNAGKSTLFNALIGERRAIVSPEAGTTRDVIRARLDILGYPFCLIDGAGLREAEGALEAAGMTRVLAAAEEAAIALIVRSVLDPSPPESWSEAGWTAPARDGPKRLFVRSQCDLAPEVSLSASDSHPWISVSAKTSEGLLGLRHEILEASPFGALAGSDRALPFSARQREGILDCLRIAAKDPLRAALALELFAMEGPHLEA